MNDAAIPLEADRDGTGAPPVAAVFLSGFLILLASLVTLLNHHGYPLARPETLGAAAFIAVLCGAATALYLAVPILTRRLMEALLIALAIDIHFTELSGTFAVFVGVSAALLLLKRSILQPLAIFGGIMFLATLAGALGTADWRSTIKDGDAKTAAGNAPGEGNPAIVHILLDEHLGFGGFPDTDNGRRTRDTIAQFYTSRDFRIYPRAYSQHLHTINAVPDILNFGDGKAVSASVDGMEVGPTKMFARLSQLGYDLTVLQADFGDYCSGADVAHCAEYNSTSLLPLLDVEMRWGDRAQVILASFFRPSQLVDIAQYVHFNVFVAATANDLPMFEPPLERYRTSTISALLMFEDLTARAAQIRPGEAVFFHSLFPHYPLVTNANCAVKPYAEWKRRQDWSVQGDRQDAYFEQLRCTAALIDGVIAALDRSPAAGNYVVVLHGDHGSRITVTDPLADGSNFTDADLTASFSTMMAIKIAGNGGGIDNAAAPVADILRAFALREYKAFPAINSQDTPTVVLDDGEWTPRRKFQISEDLFETLEPTNSASFEGKDNE